MSVKITTPYGHAIPPAPRHSVTFHMPTWEMVEKFGANPPAIMATLKSTYPRMRPHRDIMTLGTAAMQKIGATDQDAWLLFSSPETVRECIEFAISPRRQDDVKMRKPVPSNLISIRAFEAKDRFHMVIYPAEYRATLAGFWMIAGCGVSSRFAEANLEHLDRLREVSAPEIETLKAERSSFESSTHQLILERIIHYLDRAPLDPENLNRPSAKDVWLFPTGMAAIYKPHTYFLHHDPEGTMILFGMSYTHTISTFEEFGPTNNKFFGLGLDQDIRDLEDFLAKEREQGRNITAIWTEFPANPILVSPNLRRLRELADEYDTILIIDDTLGSVANVDVLSVADMIVTSLTKSFNGYADAMAGSAVLNPAGRKYPHLKSLFEKYYIPELYVDDAVMVECNSRDYLERTTKLNNNALSLVNYLQKHAEDPSSAVIKVHYPTTNECGKYYRDFMRPETADFKPGYGCLFGVEFEDLPTTIAFYENLNVHNGPHLGAPLTLALPYTGIMYATKLDWAAKNGLKPTQVRCSAGLEDTKLLLEDFRIAVQAADKVKKEKTSIET